MINNNVVSEIFYGELDHIPKARWVDVNRRRTRCERQTYRDRVSGNLPVTASNYRPQALDTELAQTRYVQLLSLQTGLK